MNHQLIALCAVWAATVIGSTARAWVLPGTYKAMTSFPSNSQSVLTHVIVEVNGQRALVPNGESFTVVQGDRVQIIEAILRDRGIRPESVNIIGFSADSRRVSEDRGKEFSTATGFSPDWAVDPEKTTFAIAVVSKKTLHGSVFMRIDRPKLKFADIVVNDRLRVMREGEVLVLSAADNLKIKNVVTNLEKNDDVDFEIIRLEDSDMAKQHLRRADGYEIRFSRKGQVFARIPMLVEGL